ncbi:hypothetical protein HDU96_006829 [Phlyctochytrium bullatum]|nr:hypothetical protein HDU96_006829 [Phlyctochytrium bullatum]
MHVSFAPVALLLALISAFALPSHAAVNGLCLRRCYAQAIQSAPSPCSPSVDFSNHESRTVLDCACSLSFIELASQCGVQNRCSDAGAASAAAAEVVAAVQDQCDHLKEHWTADGQLVTGVHDLASTDAASSPSETALPVTSVAGTTTAAPTSSTRLVTTTALTSTAAASPAGVSATTSRSAAESQTYRGISLVSLVAVAGVTLRMMMV